MVRRPATAIRPLAPSRSSGQDADSCIGQGRPASSGAAAPPATVSRQAAPWTLAATSTDVFALPRARRARSNRPLTAGCRPCSVQAMLRASKSPRSDATSSAKSAPLPSSRPRTLPARSATSAGRGRGAAVDARRQRLPRPARVVVERRLHRRAGEAGGQRPVQRVLAAMQVDEQAGDRQRQAVDLADRELRREAARGRQPLQARQPLRERLPTIVQRRVIDQGAGVEHAAAQVEGEACSRAVPGDARRTGQVASTDAAGQVARFGPGGGHRQTAAQGQRARLGRGDAEHGEQRAGIGGRGIDLRRQPRAAVEQRAVDPRQHAGPGQGPLQGQAGGRPEPGERGRAQIEADLRPGEACRAGGTQRLVAHQGAVEIGDREGHRLPPIVPVVAGDGVDAQALDPGEGNGGRAARRGEELRPVGAGAGAPAQRQLQPLPTDLLEPNTTAQQRRQVDAGARGDATRQRRAGGAGGIGEHQRVGGHRGSATGAQAQRPLDPGRHGKGGRQCTFERLAQELGVDLDPAQEHRRSQSQGGRQHQERAQQGIQEAGHRQAGACRRC